MEISSIRSTFGDITIVYKIRENSADPEDSLRSSKADMTAESSSKGGGEKNERRKGKQNLQKYTPPPTPFNGRSG